MPCPFRMRQTWHSQISFLYYMRITMTSWESNGVISHCILHGFEFRVVLLDWLLPKAWESSLLCYLTLISKEKNWIHTFPFLISDLLTVSDRAAFLNVLHMKIEEKARNILWPACTLSVIVVYQLQYFNSNKA